MNRTPIIQQLRESIDKWNLHETKKLLYSRGNYHQTKETTYRMGENLCLLYICQGINKKNIHRAKI
jgi:hypothetical protein